VQPQILGTLPTGELSCTLVRSIADMGKGITVKGNTIRIRDFGVLRLAQLLVLPHKRQVIMLDFEFGSTPEGAGQAGGAEGNGSSN
jgi:hypothetical protein